MMLFPFGESVTVLRAGLKEDPFSGETSPDWENPVETVFSRAGVAPGVSDESWQVGRNPVDTVYTVFLPFGSDVTAQDRMLVRGELFEVNGDVADWRNPLTGTEFGTVVPLKRRG